MTETRIARMEREIHSLLKLAADSRTVHAFRAYVAKATILAARVRKLKAAQS
jgi:hypothetical protein